MSFVRWPPACDHTGADTITQQVASKVLKRSHSDSIIDYFAIVWDLFDRKEMQLSLSISTSKAMCRTFRQSNLMANPTVLDASRNLHQAKCEQAYSVARASVS